MKDKEKLELTWIGKENRPRLEPRILLEDPEKSYNAPYRVTENDIFDNRLIFGDNLLALKALEQEFSGKIKCIYIDPPFNTQQAFEHYDDSIEHSLWLSLIRDRLVLLQELLAVDGTLFVHIDDNELGYLVALIDEIFGRKNRLYVITFKQGSATGHKSINPGCVNTTNFLLIYAKDKSHWSPNRVFTGRGRDDRYNQFIKNVEEHYSKWNITTLAKAFSMSKGLSEKNGRVYIKKNPEELDEFVITNAERVIRFARPSYEGVGAQTRKLIDESKSRKDTILRLEREGYPDIYLKGGERILFYVDKLKNIDGEWLAGEPLTTLWDDVLSNNLHAEGGVDFPKGKKPEALVKRVLELTTTAGDWILDSFAGSGTTAAVAHKMRRPWITIELGEHCHTHIIPRMKKVIDGKDTSGITAAVNWKGGGGFRYFRLAPSLLEKDTWGNWVISKNYNATMLASAMAKHEGFVYNPDETFYWKQGKSTEKDYIFTTTNFITVEYLDSIHEEMQSDESLLICCKSFQEACESRYENITVKKIPNMLLGRCEFGKEDYSLNITEMHSTADDAFEDVLTVETSTRKEKKKTVAKSQPGLFDDEEDNDDE